MRAERRRTDVDVLRDCWSRWTAILSLFAERRPGRSRLDPGAYADLRNELIAVCRSLAEADGPERQFYAGLEETVKPWLNLRVLARTDREILTGLARHCRQVEWKLRGRKWRLAWPHDGGPSLAIVAVGAVICGLVWIIMPAAVISLLNTVLDVTNTMWLTVKFADDWQKMSASAVIIVAGAMYIVSRREGVTFSQLLEGGSSCASF